MSGQCENYKQGWFVVQGDSWLHRHRLLMPDSTAVLLTSFLGVIITLVGTRLWVLFSVLLEITLKWLIIRVSRGQEQVPLIDVEPPDNPLTPEQTQRVQVIGEVLAITKHGDPELETGLKLLKRLYRLRHSLAVNRKEAALLFGLAILCISLFLVVTVGGIFSAYVVLDGIALCKSSNCGLWYPPNVVEDAPTFRNVTVAQVAIFNDKEEGAASHVARCYRGSRSVDGCDNLLSKSIRYNVSMAKCPLDGDVCLREDLALTLDTGWQDARVLGISSPEKYLFRRRTTCAPLVTNTTYVQFVEAPNGKITARYYYGPALGKNYTFETPLNDLTPGTNMGTYIVNTAADTDSAIFAPLLPFRSNLSTLGWVSLIQIFPHNLLLPEHSNDPIFYTNKRMCGQANPDTCSWTRYPSVASTLACVDVNEYCVDKPRLCWRVGDLHNDDIPLQNTTDVINSAGALFLSTTLRSFGRIVDGFGVRLARALKAQSFVVPNSMSAVQNGDWTAEIETFFQTSLALLQNGVVDVANGAFHDRPGVLNRFEMAGFSKSEWAPICDMVLVQSPGYKSVSLLGVLAILLLAFFITIASINPDGKLIVANSIALLLTSMWTIVWSVVTNVATLVWEILKIPLSFLWENRDDIARWLLAQLKRIGRVLLWLLTNFIALPIQLADAIAKQRTSQGARHPDPRPEPSDGVT